MNGKSITSQNILNTGVRGSSLLAKFILVTFLSKYLDIEVFGQYGLFVSVMIVSTYLIGMDIYRFTNREISTDTKTLGPHLLNHIQFLILSNLLLMPFVCICANSFLKDFRLSFMLIPMVLMEHLSLEIFRMLNALFKPLFASLFILSYHGLVAIIVIAYSLIGGTTPNLLSLFSLWVCVGFFVNTLGLFYLKKISGRISFELLSQDWVKKAVRIGFPFLLSALCLRLVENGNRFFLRHFSDLTDVAVVSLFTNFTNATIALIAAAFFAIQGPQLIRSMNEGVVKTKVRPFQNGAIQNVILLSILVAMGMPFALKIIGKSVYIDQILVFYGLLLGSVVFNFSQVWDYVLYAIHGDKWVLHANFWALVLNMILCGSLIPFLGLNGVVVAQISCFSLMLILKKRYSMRLFSRIEKSTFKNVITRRCFERVNTSSQTRFKSNTTLNGEIFCKAIVENLSEGGILISQMNAFNKEIEESINSLEMVGKELSEIKFSLNNGSSLIETNGECVWEASVNGKRYLGVRFKNMKQNYNEMIKDYVQMQQNN